MSDETPDPETPAAETPDAETPDPAAETPTEPVAAASTPAGPPADRKGVFVPRWVAILLGLVLAVGLVGGGGFWLGRETADDDDGHRRERAERPFEPRQVPPVPNLPEVPDAPGGPEAPQGRLLLGIAVEDGVDGVTVVRVTSGSPADDAGLEVGDVVTDIDGEAITEATELVAAIRSHDPGDEISLTYERDGEPTTVSVTLADLSSEDGSAS